MALWTSQAISLTGDQLARVAVASLVFDRTGSAFATGLVYAITYLPWLIGGPLLGGLADRYRRRTVMVSCQLTSAILVSLMAIPGLPLVPLGMVLFVVILLESPYLSARAALLLDVLPDDRYVLASGLGQLTIQGTQVLGFAVGGGLVAVVGAQSALLIDAASFLAAALLVSGAVHRRPAPDDGGELGGRWRRIADGAAVVFGDPWLRHLVLLAWSAFFWVVPEGLAAPLGHGHPGRIGLILAAQPAGSVLGGLVLARLVRPQVRLMLMGPLAVLACAPLLAFAVGPGFRATLTILVMSGIGTAYNLPANAAFMQGVPAHRRGQAFGLVAAGLVAGQGISIGAAGGLVGHLGSAPDVIAIAGLLGTVGALLLLTTGARSPGHAPLPGPTRKDAV